MKNVADIWPLAPLQELMLAHALSGADAESLVEQFHCRLRGTLDAAALRHAWETVVARHPMLRAAPAWEGLAKPLQVVRRTVDLPWNEIDLRDCSAEEQATRTAQLMADDRRRGFDLARPPLSRLHLARLADREWLMVWSCHHLCVDGWSLSIVMRDVFTTYEQLRASGTPQLAPCGTFGDYLKWRAAQDPAAAEEFWREQLADASASGALPAAGGSSTAVRPSIAECETRLPAADTDRLMQLAQAERVGSSVMVQAAWGLLVAQATERRDLTIGVAVSGRPPQVPMVETIVGPLLNNIPLRLRFADDERGADLFARLRDTAAAAQPYEYSAPDQIAQAADVAGPLFDTLVVYENYPLQGTEAWRLGDLEIADMHGTASSSYRLSVVALPGRELVLRMLYDERHATAADATAILHRLTQLLAQLALKPEARLGELFAGEQSTGSEAPTWRRAIAAALRPDESEEPAAMRPRPDVHAYVAPSDELETRVATVWSEVLRVEPVGMTDNFLELGGTSSMAVSLMGRLDDEFGRRLPLAALFADPTPAHLARMLRAAPQGADASPLVPLRTTGAGSPLYCIHPAGGTVFCYLEMADRLAADVPVFGLQAQGIDGTLAPHDTIEAMAQHYLRAIKSVQPSGPYRLCGWSTGGIVAFEMARQLREAGDDVSLVALFDAAIPRPEDGLSEDDLVPMLQLLFPHEDMTRVDELRDRPLDEQVAYFRERAERARVLMSDSGARSAQGVFDVFEANLRAVMAYSPRPLDARLTLVRASEQATPMHADPLLGWGAHAAGGTETFTVAGHHLTMLQQPTVAEVAELIDACLARDAGNDLGIRSAVKTGAAVAKAGGSNAYAAS